MAVIKECPGCGVAIGDRVDLEWSDGHGSFLESGVVTAVYESRMFTIQRSKSNFRPAGAGPNYVSSCACPCRGYGIKVTIMKPSPQLELFKKEDQ